MKHAVLLVTTVFLISCMPEVNEENLNTLREKIKLEADEDKKGQLESKLENIYDEIDNADYGKFTDARDGKTYKTILMRDGKTWMAENLRYRSPDGYYCPDGGSEDKCDEYGCHYEWEVAQNICPQGWRLPTNDEWWNLFNTYYGATQENFSSVARRDDRVLRSQYSQTADALIEGSKFNIKFGGYILGAFRNRLSYTNVGRTEYLWSSRKVGNRAYSFRFQSNLVSEDLSRVDKFVWPCRCIKKEEE